MKDGAYSKIHDRIWLAVSLITVTPVIILAFLTVIIGYPLHLITKGGRR